MAKWGNWTGAEAPFRHDQRGTVLPKAARPGRDALTPNRWAGVTATLRVGHSLVADWAPCAQRSCLLAAETPKNATDVPFGTRYDAGREYQRGTPTGVPACPLSRADTRTLGGHRCEYLLARGPSSVASGSG